MQYRGIAVGDRILGASADSHADWCAAYGQQGAYRFVGASAIGKLHLHNMRPRDDAFAIRTAGEWLAVAVSDGAGSREYSRYGATYAVEALCEHLLRQVAEMTSPAESEKSGKLALASTKKPGQQGKMIGWEKFWPFRIKVQTRRHAYEAPPFAHVISDVPQIIPPSDNAPSACGTLNWYCQTSATAGQKDVTHASVASVGIPSLLSAVDEECIRRAFQRTRESLEQFAQSRGFALKELHCTLLGMLLNTRTGAVAAGHIGDGLIALLHPGFGARPLVEAPTSSEVGETYVFTQSDWERYLAIQSLSPSEAAGITTFYLMSDGVADDCTHPPPEDIFQRWATDVDRELRKEMPLPQTATRLMRWLASYEVRGSWDDRTLVVIIRNVDEHGGNS